MNTYSGGSTARCPHCQTSVMFIGLPNRADFVTSRTRLETGQLTAGAAIRVTSSLCPNCKRVVIALEEGEEHLVGGIGMTFESRETHLVWPLCSTRPVPCEVPNHVRTDYTEAAAVLSSSPKASAALSRRCLQTLLREAAGATQYNLADQIDCVVKTLPTHIADQVDAIRVIGNFAAHPKKNTSTGEIIEVEPQEAEWNLDVLDLLFDFYYVQPARAKAKRDALNAKLAASGDKLMK